MPRRHREAVGEIEAAADGLCGRHHAVAAGDSVTGTDPKRGGGQFWLVQAGSMIADGIVLSALSCLFVYPEETPLKAIAGADGLEVFVLQYPRP